MQRAVGSGVRAQINPTVNPLLFNVKFIFEEAQPGPRMTMLWNLVQQYATKNDAATNGKVEVKDFVLGVQVVVKRRLGMPKNLEP